MCDEWDDFMQFYKWSMENGYADNLTIDRIDVNGNYEPSNCRWATQSEQANNKRTSVFIDHNGERKTLSQWAEVTGLNCCTIRHRMKIGAPEDLLFSKSRLKKRTETTQWQV